MQKPYWKNSATLSVLIKAVSEQHPGLLNNRALETGIVFVYHSWSLSPVIEKPHTGRNPGPHGSSGKRRVSQRAWKSPFGDWPCTRKRKKPVWWEASSATLQGTNSIDSPLHRDLKLWQGHEAFTSLVIIQHSSGKLLVQTTDRPPLTQAHPKSMPSSWDWYKMISICCWKVSSKLLNANPHP